MKRKRRIKIMPFDEFLQKVAALQSKSAIPYEQLDSLRRKLAFANYPPQKKDFLRSALDELDKRAVYSSPKTTTSSSVHLIYHHNG